VFDPDAKGRSEAHFIFQIFKELCAGIYFCTKNLKPRAFIYHFPGRGKIWDNILYSFGVSRYEAGQCEEVYAFVDAKRDEIGCIPFNEGVINRSSYCTPPYAIC